MYVQTKVMSFGKSEHTKETNEDAAQNSSERGVFAISDGTGTLLFSRQWACILAQQAIDIPLLSNDPFEVEWWLRQAQQSHEQHFPKVDLSNWNVQKKVREGSAATLALLNILSAKGSTVTAEMLAIGDSCIFVANAAIGSVRAFPLEEATDFDSAPISLSSIPRKFNRAYHQFLASRIELRPHDSIILATDAVSKWIITHPIGTRWSAFEEVAKQTPDTWNNFIVNCRQRQEMGDDDATAIVIQLNDKKIGVLLGIASPHTMAIVGQRQGDFEIASGIPDKEKMAIAYGAGQDFVGMKMKGFLSIDDARSVAEAINEIRQTFFSAFNQVDFQDRVERVWKKHEMLLQKDENRASIEALLTMLQKSGIALDLPPVTPSNARTQFDDEPKDLISRIIAALEYLRSKLPGRGQN